MAYRGDPEASKILGHQAPEHTAVKIVLAKRRLVFLEAELPHQPTMSTPPPPQSGTGVGAPVELYA